MIHKVKASDASITDETKSPGSVPALDRSLDIVELLTTSKLGMTLSELSDELAIPKNAVFRITQTLLARGYLSRNEKSLAFQLTTQFLKLSHPRWDNISLPAVAREDMIALRDQVQETVQLGVLSGLEGVIIDQIEGTQPLRIVADIGLRFMLHNNAPGKLLLANLPFEQREQVITQIQLTASTPRTITSKKELHDECEQILKVGYSTDFAEADGSIPPIVARVGSCMLALGTEVEGKISLAVSFA